MPGPSSRAARGGRRPRARKAIAVAWGEFNETITGEMRDRAVAAIEAAGYRAEPVLAVSGAYDLPFAIDRALARRDVVGAVAIGCIITGETRHDDLIAHASAKALLDVSIARGKPVGLGVTGPGQTYEQAKDRVDRAEAAVEAVLKLLAADGKTRGR
ncbi:MAG TPA: 6,7-dimethyl-8-ribityllumazine synthase [Candidatus Thermoplasmatota archaeon]|nr:6,7-dimethyl-8-ribityllumazine synthase [Candidatus Thermoplasmatota archaeon]